jgi:hypothetical protein
MPVIIFAYFGPESMLPLTSIVATVVGIFLMFGRSTMRIIRRALVSRLIDHRGKPSISMPHFPMEVAKRSPAELIRK